MKDLYQILKIDQKASTAEIRSAFRTKSKDLHPDVNPEKDQLPFQELANAHRILTDDEKRTRYDRGEDPDGPTHEARGLEMAIQTFQDILRQTLKDIETTELVILSIESIAEQKTELQQDLKKKSLIVQGLKITKERLVMKDKTRVDYLGNVIEDDLKKGAEIIGLLKDKIEACDKATDLLNNYDFETDDPEYATDPPGSVIFTITSSTSS